MQVFFILFAIILIIAAFSIKVVRQAEVYVIERFGRFHKVANAGLNIILPFVDRVRAVVNVKQQTMDVPPQGVITKDNVTITIDTVVFFQIMDPVKSVYEIENLQKGIGYLAVTTIRDIVGKMDLDSTFSSRDMINVQLREVLDEATDKWGCKVDRVEIKDINPPKDIRDAMEKQMNAERNKRAVILEAEGSRQADITRAQGLREARILEAEGTSEAIKKIADAKAQEIEMVYGAITKAKPTKELVQIKSLETLEKVAEGQANKVFIPFDTSSTLSALGAAKEIIKE